MPRTIVPRRTRRARRPPGAGTARLALLRLAIACSLLGLLIGTVPPARALLVRAGAVVRRAIDASRSAEARRERVARFAQQYGISLQLAAEIERAARAEGVDPELAFRLVRVESGFREDALSPAGALGLTQLMPLTAQELQPGITPEQILARETNLRLGFRYFRRLLRAYDGDVAEALHAYNRGPGTVDRIRAAGGDPANGYADRVLGRGSAAPYRGSGVLAKPM